jgi:Fic family protein
VTDEAKNLPRHELDAGYVPFVDFAEWSTKHTTSYDEWDAEKAELAQEAATSSVSLSAALEVTRRAAAIETGAIEGLYSIDSGFTVTVAVQSGMWQTAFAQAQENTRAHIDAQLAAYDYLIDLATGAKPLSEAWIRELHEVMCAAQLTYVVNTAVGEQEQTLKKGQYKEHPNHVVLADGSTHSYAPVLDTPPEMERLIAELRTERFSSAHPVAQAAYAHHAFVSIHPFADGNGRVARAIASVFLYRGASIPFYVLLEHKRAYLEALRIADASDFAAFERFVLDRSLEAFRLVRSSLRAPPCQSGVRRFPSRN